MKNELRYIVTDVVSIPVIRVNGKGEMYKAATKPGWGVVEWYSAINDYKAPVNRDTTDKTQQLICDEDTSATLYPKYGREFCIAPYEEVVIKGIPRQADLDAIIISDACGFSFWEHEIGDVKIFVIYDANGLIDTYRLDGWNSKPEDGETEITFADLQSEEDHDSTDRANIPGTFEHSRKLEANAEPGRQIPGRKDDLL
jgi:hypothetical protein